MQQFLKWLGTKLFPNQVPAKPASRPVGVRVRPSVSRPRSAEPATIAFRPEVNGKVVDAGPGKNVLVRNRFVREDSGTHETLKILDDSLLESEEPAGIDPYNTGRFDRAKSWEFRSRK